MALEVGRCVRYATIDDGHEGRSMGHVHMTATIQEDDGKGRERTHAFERRVHDVILVCVAGPEAEARFAGTRRNLGEHADYQTALNITGRVCGDDEEGSALVEFLRRRAINILAQPFVWCRVEDVAAALLKVRRLSGGAIREICEAADRGLAVPRG